MESKAVGNVLVWRNCMFGFVSRPWSLPMVAAEKIPFLEDFHQPSIFELVAISHLSRWMAFEMIVHIPMLLPPSRPRPRYEKPTARAGATRVDD